MALTLALVVLSVRQRGRTERSSDRGCSSRALAQPKPPYTTLNTQAKMLQDTCNTDKLHRLQKLLRARVENMGAIGSSVAGRQLLRQALLQHRSTNTIPNNISTDHAN